MNPQSFGLAFASLANEKVLVDVGDDTSTGNGSLDEEVEFLVSSDGELEMSGGDSPDFEVLGSVTSQLENLSSKVLKDCCGVDSGG